jgi:hypothetical protein
LRYAASAFGFPTKIPGHRRNLNRRVAIYSENQGCLS